MIKTSIIAAGILALTGGVSLAQYPERAITMIVPWDAGGGTDAIARMLANELSEQLGVAVNVVNRPGGGGVIGHAEILNANPDGYTIGLGTAELASFYWAGNADFQATDFAPVGLINFDAGAFHVSTSSEWEDLNQALEAIREAPAGTYQMSGMGAGAAYHLAFAGFLSANGVDPLSVTLVPSQGAAPGFQQLAAGGVHIIPSSVPEGVAMMQAGRTKPLAVFSEERLAAFPDVPTAGEVTGVAFSGGTWRGVVAPQGVDEEILDALAEALEAATSSDEFVSFMEANGFGVANAMRGDFADFLAQQHETFGRTMNDLGLAQRQE